MTKLLDEQAKVQEQIEAANAWELDRKIEIAMDALRLPPGDAGVTTLSGGERRRVALCRVLLEQPDMLLLDEPTNHLDAESVAWLERHLAEFPGTVVAVTHDRYFLDNVAGWILELDRGHGIPYEGNYTRVAGPEAHAARAGGEARVGTAAHAAARAGVGADGAAGAAGEVQSARAAVRGAGGGGHGGPRDAERDRDPAAAAAGQRCRDRDRSQKELRRHAAVRRIVIRAAAGRHCGRDRAEWRGEDHAVPDDRRAGDAGRGDARDR